MTSLQEEQAIHQLSSTSSFSNLEESIVSEQEEEVVDDRLISMLFPERTELEPEYEQYLARLTSYSVERLAKEPLVLNKEGEQIKQNMEDLAFKNYKAFIQTSECVQELHKEISKLNLHLNSLMDDLPDLSESCKSFVSKSQEIFDRRAKNKITLQNHTQLLEILEIPQLMDSFVRNEYYDEALELENFSQKLSQTYPDVKIVQDIVEEVKMCTEMMLLQLHQQLRSNIQLPACFRVIGYLKRLAVYNDRELRIIFLQNRGAWLQALLTTIPTINPYNYLTKVIDLSRTNLFEIITQYKAIFSDVSAQTETFSQSDILLCGWINHMISDFIQNLENFLPQLTDGISIQKILDQCMYYGASLSRVGVDFRGLLVPLFERTIFNLFSNTIAASTSYFIDSLRKHKFVSPPKQLVSPTESKEQYDPPSNLLDFPPLAVLANGFITGFNELRYCAPITLQHKIAERLNTGLLSVANSIQSLNKEPPRRRTDEEEEIFQNVCKVLVLLCILKGGKNIVEHFVPHVVRCFEAIYGSSEVDTSPVEEILKPIYKKQTAVSK